MKAAKLEKYIILTNKFVYWAHNLWKILKQSQIHVAYRCFAADCMECISRLKRRHTHKVGNVLKLNYEIIHDITMEENK